MKLLLSFIFLTTCIFTENVQNVSFQIKKDPGNWIEVSYIPYIQLAYAGAPGAGCCIRGQRRYLGLQFDANMGVSIGAAAREATISAIFYPWANWESVLV